MPIPDFLRVFKNRNFFIFSLSQIFSQIGDKINHFAFIALLKDLAPGSTIAFSFLGASITLPVIIFSSFAGVLIDRFERKKIMVISEILRGAFILFIVLVSAKWNTLWAVYIFIFFLFTASLFSNISKISSIPEFLKNREEILPANSINNLIVRISTLIAMLSGGVVVELAIWKRLEVKGYNVILFVNAALFIISALILLFLKIQKNERSFEKRDFFKDLKSGLKLAVQNKNVLFVYLSVMSLVFAGSVIYVLLSIFIQQILKFGTRGVGVSGAFSAIGMMLAAFLFGNYGKNLNRVRVIGYGFVFLSLILSIFPFIKSFSSLLAISFSGGFILTPVMISQDTIIHENVRRDYRGRIFSFREFFVNSMFLIFVFLNGLTGKLFGVRPAILFSSVFLLLLNLISLLIYTFRNEKDFNC